MSPNASEHEDETTDGNDDTSGETWFYKPMEFVHFKDSLRGMETEEEHGTLRREPREQQLGEYKGSETECPENLCDQGDDEETGDIRHIVNPLLDSFHTDEEVENRSATLLVPGVGRRYIKVQ